MEYGAVLYLFPLRFMLPSDWNSGPGSESVDDAPQPRNSEAQDDGPRPQQLVKRRNSPRHCQERMGPAVWRCLSRIAARPYFNPSKDSRVGRWRAEASSVHFHYALSWPRDPSGKPADRLGLAEHRPSHQPPGTNMHCVRLNCFVAIKFVTLDRLRPY